MTEPSDMEKIDRWLLPDGVEDTLPETAAKLEKARRLLLDQFQSWGYEFVIPPMVEFLESLLTGTGKDLDIQTFKVIDQLTGRHMGLRADMTPQIARIDAHSLHQTGATRLCYAGTVLHSRPDNMLASRTPMKVGAELFGDPSWAADLEIVSLMTAALLALQTRDLQIELGDVSVFREILRHTEISLDNSERYFSLVQRKAHDELVKSAQQDGLDERVKEMICELPLLCGGLEVLPKARHLFRDMTDVLAALDRLEFIAEGLTCRYPDVKISFDLSELRGYSYHTGAVFAAYVGSSGETVAKGGRYDHIGEVFGRRRAATGFDLHLLPLVDQITASKESPAMVVRADSNGDQQALWVKIEALRAQGLRVIEGSIEYLDHEQELVWNGEQWQICNRFENGKV
ncbi:MAG: ATP phosphoribosyltransferase regulatory subunit [Gammaproteobacteria bacterium]|nr:ATP phosphoribosyltransferase regulatory subunit [Gammaproteobacteria bacterium]MBT5202106.1 ATP phosphoribosyltransferase regulatory subunit [Gammaproteobacteria bacterium]MBT5601181.1 ATP phosphoribosyltransferase regulatory subunit [Gammaproteobacteria bacterium]MBT6246411.1 ATP phosphoribosyltransferase regulatory subunit [Gammaproteobacteria bacterium]